uniref:Protein FAM177A1-like n=1 Tax=Sinocyclocheilus rhinocerous TaxID=307959 RepID=A0A673I2E7_9TELE
MAELSLYLTNVNVSLGQGVDTEKSSAVVKEFENVELGDLGKKKPKIPRRTIYFASGETMEEYSTDEEEEEPPEKAKTLSTRDPSKLTWGPYVWFQMWRVATSTISVCDYLGEKMASLLGITTPKYHLHLLEEEEEEENHLSEEAERRFEEQHNQDGQQPKIEQPEGTASFVNVTFELEQESHAIPDANKVPAPIPS